MWSAFKFFDAYTIRARIFPALIAGLPAIALPFVLVRWSHIGLSNVIVATMSVILLFAFADVARRQGRRVETRLGTRSTPELWRRSNAAIPNASKDLYREFIAKQLKQAPPTEADERDEPERADDFYRGAGDWLRDKTRDKKKFNILFDELLTYGSRRNLLGLRPLSLVMNAVVAAIAISILFFMPAYAASIEHIEEKLYAVLAIVALHSLYMLFAVGEAAVREASLSYGTQLILSSATLMKAPPSPRAKSAKAGAAEKD